MKASRYNKVLGLAIGEKSILAAEVTSGEATEARRLAEFIFPDDISPTDAPAIGAALGNFLREQSFTARNVVVGLPAKWLLVKSKEVPPADDSTAANLLRLQAEGDFSSELRDLVFDYTGKADPASQTNVLLIATPQRYIDFSNQLCEAAKLEPVAVTSTSAALGMMCNRGATSSAMVLSLSAAGSELTSQSGGYTNTLRHLRGPVPEPLFINELRRLVSSIGGSNGSNREMIVWDGSGTDAKSNTGGASGNGHSNNAKSLGDALGIRVRNGDLPSLGVSTTEANRNGGGRKYAAAVALGMSVLGTEVPPINFLHSRLAAPKEQRVKTWMIYTALASVLAIGLGVFGYLHLKSKQEELAKVSTEVESLKVRKVEAEAFVSKVTFAQKWHAKDPKFMSCLNAVTGIISNHDTVFCTSLIIKEVEPALVNPTDKKTKPRSPSDLIVIFNGKAPSNQAAFDIRNAFAKDAVHFDEVKSNGISASNSAQRGTEITFSLTCYYVTNKNKTTAK